MKTEIKEFIKEQHAEACGEWKVKIEEKFPELFKSEIEVGKWYKNGNGKTLFLQLENDIRKGFDKSGKWSEFIGKAFDSTLAVATNKEVKDALIAEAKRRGFKEGVKFKDPECGNSGTFKNLDFDHFFDQVIIKNDGQCIYSGGMYVYKNGKWGDIINQNYTSEIEKEIEEIQEKLKHLKLKLK